MTPDQDCRKCKLCEGRRNVVMPDGDPDSPVAFVGEAPGKKEDEVGKPFQGSSGRVLNTLLSEEGVSRESIFITNTVKCRPPNNRAPTKEEMERCLPCLMRELEGRRLIVTLGRTAARDILGREVSLGEEANKVYRVDIADRPVDLIVAYHPAASFYNSKVKDSLRETIRIARTYLEGGGSASPTGT